MAAEYILFSLIASLARLPRGLLDVTDAPYAVDPSGTKDVTVSLRSALNAALVQNKAAFMPPGRYLISNTITVVQPCDLVSFNASLQGTDDINIILYFKFSVVEELQPTLIFPPIETLVQGPWRWRH